MLSFQLEIKEGEEFSINGIIMSIKNRQPVRKSEPNDTIAWQYKGEFFTTLAMIGKLQQTKLADAYDVANTLKLRFKSQHDDAIQMLVDWNADRDKTTHSERLDPNRYPQRVYRRELHEYNMHPLIGGDWKSQ